MLVYVFHYQEIRFGWYKSSLAPRWCKRLRAPQRLRVALRWRKGFASRPHLRLWAPQLARASSECRSGDMLSLLSLTEQTDHRSMVHVAALPLRPRSDT